MAQKVKRTRPELKRQRDALARFQRYLPMLKLKQQQLQMTMMKIERDRKKARDALERARKKFESYETLLQDTAGVDVRGLAKYEDVRTSTMNVAGVDLPVFEEVIFPEARYSFFATAAWVDTAVTDLREVSRRSARLDVLNRQYALLERELKKVIQRVNLFEKVMIPNTRENIRVIRIHLGDEMTAGVARAKIAKAKLKTREEQRRGAEEEELGAS